MIKVFYCEECLQRVPEIGVFNLVELVETKNAIMCYHYWQKMKLQKKKNKISGNNIDVRKTEEQTAKISLEVDK